MCRISNKRFNPSLSVFSKRKSEWPPLLDDSVIFHRDNNTLLVKRPFHYAFEAGVFRPVVFLKNTKYSFFTDLTTEHVTLEEKSYTYKTKVTYYPWVGKERVVEIVRYSLPILKSGQLYPHSNKPRVKEYDCMIDYNHICLNSLIDYSIYRNIHDYIPDRFVGSVFSPVSDKKLQCNLTRAQKKVKNLIRSNWMEGLSRHTTLTYKERDIDFSESKKHLDRFQKRLNRYWKKNFNEPVKMLWVAERQKETRDTVHFHIVIFNHYYTNKQSRELKNRNMTYNDYNDWFRKTFWRLGYTETTHKVRNKTYCAKYLTKSNDFSTEINKRIWSSSRGLLYTKPVYFHPRMPDIWVERYKPMYTKRSDNKEYNYCVQRRE